MRETQIPQAIEDGANEAGQLVSRPSPTANLVGNWKGDPLIREVRGVKFTPNKNVMARCIHRGSVTYWNNYGLPDIGHRHYRFPWVLGVEKIQVAKVISSQNETSRSTSWRRNSFLATWKRPRLND